MVGYTGQSLLVIIVAILQISAAALVARNLRYVLFKNTWKVPSACIIFSLASICFRALTSWFIQDPNSFYYIVTYNITSISILIGCGLWLPFIFCKSEKYYSPSSSSNDAPQSSVNNRPRPVSTNGALRLSTYRPNNDGRDEELPSYYEMISPPAYKKKTGNITDTVTVNDNHPPAESTENNSGSSSHTDTIITENNHTA
ncbi:hypothetical protein [Parasitella parasitica]|uniref:Uncharacterized protein n=1 Tax=Parasitella parasitica TaxID=35722 RepID=A0A0B7MVW4_9FUNG|nr:hypothetical protein [Parasitella parasitica]